jgi:hypothetical protein
VSGHLAELVTKLCPLTSGSVSNHYKYRAIFSLFSVSEPNRVEADLESLPVSMRTGPCPKRTIICRSVYKIDKYLPRKSI